MSSILTNTSAMVALQTLKSINTGLEQTQSEISTGKSIANAKDNSAIWAISKVMESDVNGFKAISDSLSLGESTVAVAQTAAETVTDLLGEIKEKMVAAQGDNVDRTKLNNDVTALKEQITSVVSAAQFNGLNLVDGSAASTNVLASIDRDSTGAVTAKYITVAMQDLGSSGYTAKSVFSGGTNTVVSGAGDTFVMSLDQGGGSDTVVIGNPTYTAGESVSISVSGYTASYTVSANDIAAGNTPEDIIATNLKAQIESLGITGLTVAYDSAAPGQLTFDNSGTLDLTVTGQFGAAGAGGLAALSSIDATGANLDAQLISMETLISTAISAAAAFGSVGNQIETQASFVSKLTDSMRAGIGSLVDADMEEASAKLQALQVQQQLGIQALSIANQAPQNVLSLFQ